MVQAEKYFADLPMLHQQGRLTKTLSRKIGKFLEKLEINKTFVIIKFLAAPQFWGAFFACG